LIERSILTIENSITPQGPSRNQSLGQLMAKLIEPSALEVNMREIRFPADPVTPSAEWPQTLRDEFASNSGNVEVGQRLLSETERVKIWYISLKPGERLPVHKHLLDYFWTVTSAGHGQSHAHDGSQAEHTYQVGETLHRKFDGGEFMMHDLQNIGETDLAFITVEFVDSPNSTNTPV
jgi:quercetin dioxygenase-like cupin family protein